MHRAAILGCTGDHLGDEEPLISLELEADNERLWCPRPPQHSQHLRHLAHPHDKSISQRAPEVLSGQLRSVKGPQRWRDLPSAAPSESPHQIQPTGFCAPPVTTPASKQPAQLSRMVHACCMLGIVGRTVWAHHLRPRDVEVRNSSCQVKHCMPAQRPQLLCYSSQALQRHILCLPWI